MKGAGLKANGRCFLVPLRVLLYLFFFCHDGWVLHAQWYLIVYG